MQTKPFLRSLYCFLLLPLFAFGISIIDEEAPDVASTEGLPSSLVNQTVCAISGEFTTNVVDCILPGPEPLVVSRHYESSGDWSFNHLDRLFLIDVENRDNKGESKWFIHLMRPSGAQLTYWRAKSKPNSKQKEISFSLRLPKGLTNGATILSGRSNIRNQKVFFYPEKGDVISVSPSGDRSTYTRTRKDCAAYVQSTLEKPNGSLYLYKRKEKNSFLPLGISCQNKQTKTPYSHVEFDLKEDKKDHTVLRLKTSDKRECLYTFFHQKIEEKRDTFIGFERFRETDCLEVPYLKEVNHSYAPKETYHYDKEACSEKLHLVRQAKPHNRFLAIDYYHDGVNHVGQAAGNVTIKEKDDFRLNRVKRLNAPVGHDQTPITTHRFVYQAEIKKHHDGRKEWLEGSTDVYDAYNHLTRYAYNAAHRLTSIIHYSGTSHHQPYSQECYLWGPDKTKQEGNLEGKIFKGADGKVHHASYFAYDDRGNVTTKALYGKLTGLPKPEVILNNNQRPIANDCECEWQTYAYSGDDLNLLKIEVDSNGNKTQYEYVPGTDRLKAKFIHYNGGIQQREFYSYDKNGVLILKIEDDGKSESPTDLKGVTERHLTEIVPRKKSPLGLPDKQCERYLDLKTGQENLLKSILFAYSPQGELLKQEVYDANECLAYTLSCEYDLHGNVTREVNALGEVTTKEYDANDNLIKVQGPDTHFFIRKTYDHMNRPVSKEEVHDDHQRFVTHYSYNYLGQCVKAINPSGQVTEQIFDDFGRLKEIQLPPVLNEHGELCIPTQIKDFDIAGCPTCLTDPKGHKTYVEYNIRGKPTKIAYPDGSSEGFVYRIDGELMQKMYKNGTRTVYSRDPLGRITEEAVYNSQSQLLKRSQSIYNAYHLLQTIDAEGTVTSYDYDYAGRLEWVRTGEQQHQYLYDALGRQREVREWFGFAPHEYRATLKDYDALDRVIEERLETADGLLLHLTKYAYDSQGNQILKQIGEQITLTEYHSHGDPVKITDALGQTTSTTYDYHFKTSYGENVLQTTITDPLGYQTIQTYDTANRLAETNNLNPFGVLVSAQTFFYDLCGNLCRTLDHVIENDQIKRSIETIQAYTADNQLTTLIEASSLPEQKITHFSYNSCGQKAEMIKPNGVRLFYDYDELERLISLRSSNETVNYLYEYNLRDQVIRSIDRHLGQVTERVYNSLGQLTQETLGHGLSLQYAYDRTGRARLIMLPDKTGIEYIYHAADLKEVHRLVNGRRTYSYFDQHHTLDGQVTQSQLPNGQLIRYSYDALGRCVSSNQASFSQHIPPEGFDASGNLCLFYREGMLHTFTYDDHYQLATESGESSHAYTFDSLRNRMSKDGKPCAHNALHQLLEQGEETCSYNLNGNMKERQKGGIKVKYTYDALDRLTKVEQGGTVIIYTYDGFNRRLTRKKSGQEKDYFIYQEQTEIGRWVQGKCEDLRLIGKNKHHPIIAIELKGTLYLPLHDIQGHVSCLLDQQGRVVERYSYSAFGETQILGPNGEKRAHSLVNNPWQYASQRKDEETGLLSFSQRDYDPILGCWLTPDPAGFIDGSNRYVYVNNSPLIYNDFLGLFIVPAVNALVDGIAACICKFIPTWGPGNEPRVRYCPFQDRVNRSDCIYEPTRTYQLKDMYLTNPQTGSLLRYSTSPYVGIGYINGICNTFKGFKKTMSYLGQFSTYNIEGVHSATNGTWNDVLRYIEASYQFIAHEEGRELISNWKNFILNSPSTETTYLQFGFSGGCMEIRNALIMCPEEVRQRIELALFGPAGYSFDHLCKRVTHYASNGDIVPLLDLMGRQGCTDTIIPLSPKPWYNVAFDHYVVSKTYRDDISNEIGTHTERMKAIETRDAFRRMR